MTDELEDPAGDVESRVGIEAGELSAKHSADMLSKSRWALGGVDSGGDRVVRQLCRQGVRDQLVVQPRLNHAGTIGVGAVRALDSRTVR